MIRRRAFIVGLGGTVAAWPLAGGAQQAGKLPTIGYMTGSSVPSWNAAFVQRLRELGWVEGRTVAIEYMNKSGMTTSPLGGSRPRAMMAVSISTSL